MSKILPFTDLFDSHCHLNDSRFDEDRDEVVDRAIETGVKHIVDVAVDVNSAGRSLELSGKYKGVVHSTVGIYPEFLIPGASMFKGEVGEDEVLTRIEDIDSLLSKHKGRFLMVGECGLDYYWLVKNVRGKEEFDRSVSLQKLLFEEQIKLAVKHKLPLTVHHRESTDDCLELLAKYPETRAIFHSFTGDLRQANAILSAGHNVGINGIITFPNATELQQVVKGILDGVSIESPQDLYEKGVYLETDSPYLAPQAKRGKRNEPENISAIFRSLVP